MIAYAAVRDPSTTEMPQEGAGRGRATARPHNLRRHCSIGAALYEPAVSTNGEGTACPPHEPTVRAADRSHPARRCSHHRRGRSRHPQLRPFAATGQGEPLRCCLRYAEPGEQIALISYAPFEHPSVWREVGPVYIHAARCQGYTPTGRLPEQLATGPRRTYRADDTMNYGHNAVVTDEADL